MSKKDRYQFNSSKGFSMSDENTSSTDVNVVSNTLESTTDTPSIPPVAVVKPATQPKKSTNSTQVKPAVKTTTPQNPTNVDKLNNLIKKFETTLGEKKDTISDWINLCNYLNKTNDPKVFQAFYVWFAKHLTDYTSATIALAGVHNIQNANTKTRVSSTHQCFEELSRVLASRTAHYRFTMKSMQAMAISEQLARWLLTKGTH